MWQITYTASWKALPVSMRGVTAVHGEGMADYETGAGAAQPQHGSGDLLRPAETPDRLIAHDFFHGLRLLGQHFGHHRGFDRARAHGVDADAARGVFEGCTLRKPDHAVLSRWYMARPGSPIRPPIEEQLTIAPLPWSRMWRSSYFMQFQTPRRLTACTRSYSAPLASAISMAGDWMPALL